MYHEANLSALAVSNLAGAVLSEMQILPEKNPVADRPEFLKTELKIGSQIIRGELSIMDYIAASANVSRPNSQIFLQGQASDLRFDEWVYISNTKLRPLMATYLEKKDGQAISAPLKQIVKDFEE